MRKNRFNLLTGMLLACLGLFCLPSCSNAIDKLDDTFAEYASCDNLLVMSGDAWTVYENAGCVIKDDEIEFSEELETTINKIGQIMSSSERDKFEDVMELKGIDPHKAYFILDIFSNKPAMACLLAVSNEEKFAELIEELGFESDNETDGYKVWSYYDVFFLLKDGVAFMVPDTEYSGKVSKAIKTLDKLKGKADEAPLKDWQKDKFSKEETFCAQLAFKPCLAICKDEGVDVLGELDGLLRAAGVSKNDIKNGYAMLSGDIKDQSTELVFNIVNAEGNPVNGSDGVALSNAVFRAPVDTSLLKYAHDTDLIVGMIAVDNNFDWQSVAQSLLRLGGESSSRAATYAAAFDEVLRYFDGTVMVGFGINPDIQVTRMENEDYVMQNINLDMAAQLAPGKANEVLQLIVTGLDSYKREIQEQQSYYDMYSYDYYYYGSRPESVNYSYNASANSITVTQGSLSLNIRVEGNTLVASFNKPITTSGGSPVKAETFQGTCGGIVSTVAKNSPLMRVANTGFGTEASLIFKKGGVSFTSSVTGTEMTFMQAYLNLINKF